MNNWTYSCEQFNSMNIFACSLLKKFLSLISAFLVSSALLKWTHLPVVPACNRGLCLNLGLDCVFTTTWIRDKYWRRKWRRDRLCTSFVKCRGISALLYISSTDSFIKNIVNSTARTTEVPPIHPPNKVFTIPGGGDCVLSCINVNS